MPVATVYRSPATLIGDVELRLLALEVTGEAEIYHIETRRDLTSEWSSETMRYGGGSDWLTNSTTVSIGTPDQVFSLAMDGADCGVLTDVIPHWPEDLRTRLERRGLSGDGTIAFDGVYFLETLKCSAIERPLLLPRATAKLGLNGLQEAAAGQTFSPMRA